MNRKFGYIEKFTKTKFTQPFVAFDLETTGLNPRKDTIVGASFAAWGHGWGTENDFYAKTFAGKANQIREWRRYAIWTGESTLPVNTHFRYDPEGPYARHKHAAVSMFQSQGGTIYADAALALDRYYGGMIGVGDDDGTAREKFDVVRSTTVVTPQWRD
jgi:hypothetical protein